MTIEVVATDWDCPKYITRRYTADQVKTTIDAMQTRIDHLEAQAERT